jgi:twitching motility two-component system response regulator PilG
MEPRRQAAEDTFRKAGFQVCSANDGFGCYLKLRSERPDLVILQTMLPMVSGLQVLQSLREGTQTRRLPVIVLADDDEMGSLSDAESSTRELYLPNSVSPATLVTEATRMLANGEWASPKDAHSSPLSGEPRWGDRWARRCSASVRDSA